MRRTASSGSPLEPDIGFSRACRIGNVICVSGTAPIDAKGETAHVGDVYRQTRRCLEISAQAIVDCGGELRHVIRTRIMLVDIRNWREAARAHGEYFADLRPACTFVEVKGFILPEWLVETELDCVVE